MSTNEDLKKEEGKCKWYLNVLFFFILAGLLVLLLCFTGGIKDNDCVLWLQNTIKVAIILNGVFFLFSCFSIFISPQLIIKHIEKRRNIQTKFKQKLKKIKELTDNNKEQEKKIDELTADNSRLENAKNEIIKQEKEKLEKETLDYLCNVKSMVNSYLPIDENGINKRCTKEKLLQNIQSMIKYKEKLLKAIDNEINNKETTCTTQDTSENDKS